MALDVLDSGFVKECWIDQKKGLRIAVTKRNNVSVPKNISETIQTETINWVVPPDFVSKRAVSSTTGQPKEWFIKPSQEIDPLNTIWVWIPPLPLWGEIPNKNRLKVFKEITKDNECDKFVAPSECWTSEFQEMMDQLEREYSQQ